MGDYEAVYEAVTGELQTLVGEKVRLTYANGWQLTGVVSTKDYGHCVDVRLNGRGGQNYGDVRQIEVKRGARYEAVAA